MPTVLDSFVLEIGMDPKNFTKGQQEAYDALKKTQDQALKGGKAIEESSKKSNEALGGLKTQAVELFAAFLGGKGIVEFTKYTIAANANLGRLERNLNISSTTIAAWQGVAKIFGGDAQQMAATFTTMTDAVEGFKIGAISPLIAEYRALSAAGGTVIDVNKGIDQTLLDIAENLAVVNAKNPALAGTLGRRLGIDPGLFDILVKGRDATQQMLDKVRALSPATKEATDAAGELERRWNAAKVRADAFGRSSLTVSGRLLKEFDKPNALDAKPWDAIFGWGEYAKDKQPTDGIKADAPNGAFANASQKEAFIRSEARRRGIDPDIAMKVAMSEGFKDPVGDNGTSFGAFQLHVTPGGRGRAVGDQFREQTGLDPSDRANEARTIQFALDNAKKHGWGDYHGAQRVGLGNWAGIGQGGSTSTTEVNINGPININAGSGADGKKMAQDFTATLKAQSFAAQANHGDQ